MRIAALIVLVALACLSTSVGAETPPADPNPTPSPSPTPVVATAGNRFPPSAYGPTEYWKRIQELTPAGPNIRVPFREIYLTRLTKDQMLEAARQYAQEAGTTGTQATRRDGAQVGIPLSYYLRWKTDRGLDDDRLAALLECVKAPRETPFFRQSIVYFLFGEYWYSGALDPEQRSFCREQLLAVIADREAPAGLRIQCCDLLGTAFYDEYRVTVLRDKNVEPLLAAKAETDVALFARVRAGEIALEPAARDSLQLLLQDARTAWPILKAVSERGDESLAMKMASSGALAMLSGYPVHRGE